MKGVLIPHLWWVEPETQEKNLFLVLTLPGTAGDLVWLKVQPHNYGFVCVGVALSGLPGIPTPIFAFPLGVEEAPAPPPCCPGVTAPDELLTLLIPARPSF